MGFSQGVSGLNVAAANLDVIGNNIANSGTVGFKSSNVQFSDVFAGSQIGLGSQVSSLSQNFAAGSVQTSTKVLDVAITNGDGFFRMASPGGEISYSRNGQFNMDKDGFLVNAAGLRLTGMPVGTSGSIAGGSPIALQLPLAAMAPKSTSAITAQFNIDSRSTSIPYTTKFDAKDSTTYNYANAVTVYDSLGDSHQLSTFFVKTASNTWDVYATADGVAVKGTAAAITAAGIAAAAATAVAGPIRTANALPGGAVALAATANASAAAANATAATANAAVAAATAASAAATAKAVASAATYASTNLPADLIIKNNDAAVATALLAAIAPAAPLVVAATAANAAAIPLNTAAATANATAAPLIAAEAAADAAEADAIANQDAVTSGGKNGELTFDSNGKLTAPADGKMVLVGIVFPNGSGSLDFTVDATGTSQFGNDNDVKKLTQDGFASGVITSYAIDKDGIVSGKYSNQQSETLGQIVLSSFINPNGLQAKGDNVWSETPTSGQPLTGTPGVGTKRGALVSGALESSNVDLTGELVNLIIAQRTYQANSQTVKTQDQVMQTLINMR